MENKFLEDVMEYTKAQQEAEKAGEHFFTCLFAERKPFGLDYPVVTI